MVQLIFVHGVATRSGPEYERAVKNRNALFQDILFEGRPVDISSPMWGKFVPDIDQRVFQTDKDIQTLSLNVGDKGLGGGLMGPASIAEPKTDLSVAAVGKQDPVVALDAIFSALLEAAQKEDRPLLPEEIDAFRKTVNQIDSGSAKNIFQGDISDEMIAVRLNEGNPASFGIRSTIGNAITNATNRIRNAASTLGFGLVRSSLNPTVGLFLGDVFVYLKAGPPRAKIQEAVAEALIKAYQASKGKDQPIVVVGHSLGGVILTDMLTDLKTAGLPDDLEIAALLTVGSQPGFFASLNLLANSALGSSKPRKPDCVADWLNVFDPIDPLAFRTDMIFQGVTDLSFNSVTGLASAHSSYFHRPQFYARCRRRLRDLGIL